MLFKGEKQRNLDQRNSEEFTRCKVVKIRTRTRTFEYTDIDNGEVVEPEEYEKRLESDNFIAKCLYMCDHFIILFFLYVYISILYFLRLFRHSVRAISLR